MVPMRMSDEEVRIQRFPVCNEMVAQTANAGSRIKDDQLVVVETKLKGGCISSITDGRFTRCRN